jgi:hypothetical protein
MVGGMTLWCSASATLSKPAAPAADFVWPICDFTEPTATLWRSTPANASLSPSISAASPARVPVPWASTSSTVPGA